MATPLGLYAIRIQGRLGATALSAFPAMVSECQGGETVLTGMLEDRAALFGVIAQIEALGLDLLEVRHISDQVAIGGAAAGASPSSGEDHSPASG